MAKKLNIKIDLAKVYGAFVHELKGKTGTKECICIPTEYLFKGKNNAVYIGITAFESNGNYGTLYSLKQSVTKDVYKSMTEEKRRAIPFLGDIRNAYGEDYSATQSPTPSAPVVNGEDDGDLPF